MISLISSGVEENVSNEIRGISSGFTSQTRSSVSLAIDAASSSFMSLKLLKCSYFPKINDDYGALCCASLRKSLKNKSIRGSKELSHVVLFDSIPNGVYAIDSNSFDKYKREYILKSCP